MLSVPIHYPNFGAIQWSFVKAFALFKAKWRRIIQQENVSGFFIGYPKYGSSWAMVWLFLCQIGTNKTHLVTIKGMSTLINASFCADKWWLCFLNRFQLTLSKASFSFCNSGKSLWGKLYSFSILLKIFGSFLTNRFLVFLFAKCRKNCFLYLCRSNLEMNWSKISHSYYALYMCGHTKEYEREC